MSYIFYYSNMCNPSKNVLQHIQNIPDIHFICIDKRISENGKQFILLESGQRIILPEIVERVPALLIIAENYRILYGNDIVTYFANKPLLSSAPPPPSSSAMGSRFGSGGGGGGGGPGFGPGSGPMMMAGGGGPSPSPAEMDPESYSFSSFSNVGISDSFSFIGLDPENNAMQQMRNFVPVNEAFTPSSAGVGGMVRPNMQPQMQPHPHQQLQHQQQQPQQPTIPSQSMARQDRIPSFINSEYLTNLRNTELGNFRR